MMICSNNIQMVHVGVATWCWLLALGIGSGLPDLSWLKKTMNHTTKYSANISGFQHNVPTLTTVAPHLSTSTTNIPLNDHSATPAESRRPSKKGPPERVQVPVQNSHQPRFVRLKHGPQTTSKFVIKVMTDTFRNTTSTNLTSEFPVSRFLQNSSSNKTRNQHNHKRIVSIGIPASSHLVTSSRTTTSGPSTSEGALPESDEYYSSYVEYPDFAVNSVNSSGYREGAILPDPDLSPEDEPSESEPDALIPDDSLADTDLHDHDLIDSVMYIYFGTSDRDEGGVGKQVLIVGAVIALVAQFVTLACVFRRLRTRPEDQATLIILNAEVASGISNLTFMLGIQATGDRSHCQLVAMTLHYLHLVTCSWYFVNTVNAYRNVHNPEHRTKIRLYCILTWISPAIVVMICFLLNQKGYEVRSYCWMSLEKGMLFSFMIPISILILLNTLFAVMGLREVSLLKSATDANRKSLRVAATLLPMFAVVWFLGVVALENSASLVFPFLFVTTNGFMNWFIFACWLPPDLSVWKESDDEFEDEDDDLYEEIPAILKNQNSTNDVQPLLEDNVYFCGRRDVCELQMDPICTISS